jgi:hypothetical protein
MAAPQGYRTERMPFSEVEAAVIDWAAREGWNPGLNDAACFYAIDPNVFFMGVLDGRPIARGSALIYDEHFAFCGLYIVDPAYRVADPSAGSADFSADWADSSAHRATVGSHSVTLSATTSVFRYFTISSSVFVQRYTPVCKERY